MEQNLNLYESEFGEMSKKAKDNNKEEKDNNHYRYHHDNDFNNIDGSCELGKRIS